VSGWDTQKFDFRSYPFSELRRTLTVRGLTLIGSEEVEWKPEHPVELAGADFSLNLFEELEDRTLDEWTKLRLDMEIGPVESIGDHHWIQAICEDTRLEVAVPVDSSGPMPLELSVHDLRGKLRVRLLATSTKPSSPGLVVAASPIFEIALDRPALLPGGGLRFEWSSERFQDVPDALFSIDFGAASEPVIYLNQTIPGFEPVLSSHRGGSVGAARRFLLSLIETEVRVELLRLVALRARETYEREEIEGLTDSDLEDGLAEIDHQILRMGVEKLGTGRETDAVAGLLRDLTSEEGHERARLRLVGRGSTLGGDLAGLIETIEKRGR
jgi:hypothetical protein